MDSSLARSPSFHHVLLNSTRWFVCNPDRQTHMSRDILAAGHRFLGIGSILTQSESFFNCPARVKVITGLRLVALNIRHFSNTTFLDCKRFIPALSECDGTNITMIANNCPSLNETSYSKFTNFLTAESPVSPTETAWIELRDGWGLVFRLEDTDTPGEERWKWAWPDSDWSKQRGQVSDGAADPTPMCMNIIFQSTF